MTRLTRSADAADTSGAALTRPSTMASIHQLRQLERRPASTRGRLSLFWQRLSLLLLACSTALGTIVVHALAHRHGGTAASFLQGRLGAPQTAPDLVRVKPEGYRIVVGKRSGGRRAAPAQGCPTPSASAPHSAASTRGVRHHFTPPPQEVSDSARTHPTLHSVTGRCQTPVHSGPAKGV